MILVVDVIAAPEKYPLIAGRVEESGLTRGIGTLPDSIGTDFLDPKYFGVVLSVGSFRRLFPRSRRISSSSIPING
jgi:hypothetical protein